MCLCVCVCVRACLCGVVGSVGLACNGDIRDPGLAGSILGGGYGRWARNALTIASLESGV